MKRRELAMDSINTMARHCMGLKRKSSRGGGRGGAGTGTDKGACKLL